MKTFLYKLFFSGVLLTAVFLLSGIAQTQTKTALQYYQEINNYTRYKAKEIIDSGRKLTAADRDEFEKEKKSLAGKYAATIAANPNLSSEDILYLGFLYDAAENDNKALENFQKYLNQLPPNTEGDAVQAARTRVLLYAGRKKQFDEMEKAFDSWLKGTPGNPSQKPTLEAIMAGAYFKDGKYEQAIKYGEDALKLVENLEAKTWSERSKKTDIYANLVEILVLSYQKSGRKEDALNILAQGRVLAFTIPSAVLYRKVMDIVGRDNISEKKLMQKVESIQTADPAPELTVKQWVGQEPTSLENLRGKVVLLDFWATWCGPCISTFPRLRDWHKKYSPAGLTIIGITHFNGNDGEKPLTPPQEIVYLDSFKEKYKMPYGIAVAEYSDSEKFGVSAIPTTFLLDRHGVVRYIGIGAGTEESENLEEMIKKVLKEQ